MMHEVGLMEEALRIVLEQARLQEATKIHRIGLRVGTASGVDPEALRFAFEVVTHDTLAEGAELDMEITPAICLCPDCQEEFRPRDEIWICPKCDRICMQLSQGGELDLGYIEVS